MLKQILFFLSLSTVLLFSSCDRYKKTESGLEYKIIVDSNGTNAGPGDFIMYKFSYTNEKDTIKEMTRRNMLSDKIPAGSFQEGLSLMSPGDSAVFKISNDTIYGENFPDELKEGSFSEVYVRMLQVEPKAVVQKKMEEQKKQQEEQQKKIMAQYGSDTTAIKDYLKSKGIKAKRTEYGVFYVITKKGSGVKVGRGDSVKVNYTGKLMENGKEFDSSIGKAPFEFVVGIGSVIPGWDDAFITALSGGDKATIYVPSVMAYGEQGAGSDIPPNSQLIFDLEVLDVKKMPVEPAK